MIKHKHFVGLVFLLVALALVVPEDANAQRRGGRVFRFQNILEHDLRPYHFGFTVGVNTLDFALKPQANLSGDYQFTYILPAQDYGFHVGIVSNLKLHEYFDLRFIPTFSFGSRHIHHYYGDFDDPYAYREEFDASILDFPVHIKYKSARMTNTRAYIIGGVKYSYDLNSFEGKGEDPLSLRTARNDFHYEIGVGFDHYFYYFKFSTEIKASFGFKNILIDGVAGITGQGYNINRRYWESIDRLNSRSIMISFLFE